MARHGNSIRLNYETAKSDEELKRFLKVAADQYNRYLERKLLFIFHENRKDPVYDCYEAFFGKENFMHLAGFSRGDISAAEFFDKCLDESLLIKEVRFSENRKSASAKLDVLAGLLDYKNAIIYKIGEADLITLKNKFELAIGKDEGLMGFDKRTSALPVPVTVIKRTLTEFVSKPQKVVAVFSKEKYDDFYETLIGGPRKGLSLSMLPNRVRQKLSPDLPEELRAK